jgi:NAD(P)-dependent dehydrogenase (short-subunit alcohol dehydrogenase family)
MDRTTALVTGASRGIGAEIARTFDRAGMRVALAARDTGLLEQVASGLSNDPVVIGCDLESRDGPGRLGTDALEALGHVDVLVNNAAVGWRGAITEVDADLVDRILHTNVRAPLLLVAALAPHMVERGSGSIVNLSSISGVTGTPNRSAYAASKAAIDGMTRSLANELGPAGIRVNAVAPGVVDTDLWKANRAIPGVIEQVEAGIPLRRWSTPDDIADVVAFLASDAARYITGETISADGGMAATRELYSGTV